MLVKRMRTRILAALAASALLGLPCAEPPFMTACRGAELESQSLAHDFTFMSDEPLVCDAGDACYDDTYHWFAGAEYRYLRPTFSEAVAFATVTDSFVNGFERQVTASELSFDYDSAPRLFFGVQIGPCQDLRVSYWNLDNEVAVDGTAGADQTIVDPFGNLGLAGSTINTTASVKMNIFDLEYLQSLNFPSQDVNLLYSAGLRFADIEQDYDSVIRDAGGNVTSDGLFTAEFAGVGPSFSLAGSTSRERRFSLMARSGATVLIGSYDVASSVTIPGVATGGQSADRTRAVPVLEGELGGSWHPNDRFTLSLGWMVQAWFNIGTSGGTFDGENLPIGPVDTVFGQTDDADIMSFDGVFVRSELWF